MGWGGGIVVPLCHWYSIGAGCGRDLTDRRTGSQHQSDRLGSMPANAATPAEAGAQLGDIAD